MLVKELIKSSADKLTASERKLAAAILADYPYNGLLSIQDLAEHAEVSPPSISRFVNKIGVGGYQDFQRQIIRELKEGQLSPVDLHSARRDVTDSYLGDFTERASQQMRDAAAAVTDNQFSRVCDILADQHRSLYIIGGRVTDSIAFHLSFHLRQTRRSVYHLPTDPETWPEYLLRMRPNDCVFIVDFRRYQRNLNRLAMAATKKRGAKVILMTDKWISPIARHAAEVLPVPIDSGTLWDTYTPALAIIEAIVTKIAEDNFETTRKRIEDWDELRLNEGNN